jgi:hypothetical protein
VAVHFPRLATDYAQQQGAPLAALLAQAGR